MDNFCHVAHGKGTSYIEDDPCSLCLIECTMVNQMGEDCASSAQLHDQIDGIVILKPLMKVHNVGMLDLLQNLDFAL